MSSGDHQLSGLIGSGALSCAASNSQSMGELSHWEKRLSRRPALAQWPTFGAKPELSGEVLFFDAAQETEAVEWVNA